jgi:hypothetical protein
MEVETVAEHGTTEDGSAACCKRVNQDSLIDCAACLEEEWGALYGSIGGKDRDQFQLILDAVTGSGAKGITKRDLLVGPPTPDLFSTLTATMTGKNGITRRRGQCRYPEYDRGCSATCILGRVPVARAGGVVVFAGVVSAVVGGTDEDFPASVD